MRQTKTRNKALRELGDADGRRHRDLTGTVYQPQSSLASAKMYYGMLGSVVPPAVSAPLTSLCQRGPAERGPDRGLTSRVSQIVSGHTLVAEKIHL